MFRRCMQDLKIEMHLSIFMRFASSSFIHYDLILALSITVCFRQSRGREWVLMY